MILRTLMAASAIAHTLGTVAVAAQEAIPGGLEVGKEGELANFAKPEPGERICYARTYSADHLKSHPRQTVTEMRFRLAYVEMKPEPDIPEGQRNYFFELAAKRGGHEKLLRTLGECFPNGQRISCMVECDGGGVRVQRRGESQVLINFGDYGRIRMSEGCGEDEADEESGVELEPGVDDKEFLLTRVPDEQCPAYDKW